MIDSFDEEMQSQITAIMADDFGIEDQTKAIEDIITIYEKDRLNSRKLDILNLLEKSQDEEKRKLERGYNQTELIARVIANKTHLKLKRGK